MAVFHKKYKNTGLNAMGVSYQIGDDGRLSPDPDEKAAKTLAQLANYEIREEKAAVLETKVEKAESKTQRRKKKASKVD